MGDPDSGQTLVAFVRPEGASSAPTPRVGDRYEVLELLGKGGMGTVYRVRDLELDEIVALKRLRSDLVDTPGVLDRFRREVKLARRISHPNVVRTFDLGEHGAERWLTMEYVDGCSLASLVARGPMSVQQAVAITLGVCAGVGAAHAAGVLHRDLKPENVLLESTPSDVPPLAGGRVVLTDFGIARSAIEASGAHTIGAIGTPSYMAPEQVQGGQDLDARVDIYAVGAVLFELLTGERAWPGRDPFAVAFARLNEPTPDPRTHRPDLAAELAEIVVRCMARDRDARFATAEELASALSGAPLDASGPLSVWRPVPRAAARQAPTADTLATTGDLFTELQLTQPVTGSLPAPSGVTLAVLPFRNAGPPEDDYAAGALTEEIGDGLSTSRGLRVRAGGRRPDDGDARAAGEALDVQFVVDGSVRRLGETLRISVRLVNVSDGYQPWARRYECNAGDALVTSDTIVRDIATTLLGTANDPSVAASADAYAVDLYLRARHELKRSWNTGPHDALAWLRQAIDRAPEHPEILSTYALAAARCAFFGGDDADAVAEEARAASERAVLLAAQATESWTALATVCWNEGDMPGAGRALRRAVSLSPANARAQEMLGMLLLEAGRPDEAVVRLRAAMSLDPNAITARSELIRANALLGRWEQVDRLFEGIPTSNDTERFGRAMANARLAVWRSGEPHLEELPEVDAASPSTRMAMVFVQMVHDIRRSGRIEPYQRQLLLELEPPRPSRRLTLVNNQMLAELFAFAGEIDIALDRIELAVGLGLEDLTWMDRCPSLASVRDDPRWPALHATVRDRAARVTAAIDDT